MHCEKVDFLLFYVLIYFLLYFILCDGNVIDSLLSWYKNYMIYIYIYRLIFQLFIASCVNFIKKVILIRHLNKKIRTKRKNH